MERLAFPFETKRLAESGQFEGWASTYGNIDQGNDVVERGSFTESIAKRGDEIPVLWSHDTANPVGLGRLSDSPEGLWLKGEFDFDTQAGKEAYSRAKKKIVKGLSIGFRIAEGGATFDRGVRRLTKIDLFEVSLVLLPMNERAKVVGVKSGIQTIRDFEAMLREAGYSKSEACKLALHGFKGLGMADEPDPENLDAARLYNELRDLQRESKFLFRRN